MSMFEDETPALGDLSIIKTGTYANWWVFIPPSYKRIEDAQDQCKRLK